MNVLGGGAAQGAVCVATSFQHEEMGASSGERTPFGKTPTALHTGKATQCLRASVGGRDSVEQDYYVHRIQLGPYLFWHDARMVGNWVSLIAVCIAC